MAIECKPCHARFYTYPAFYAHRQEVHQSEPAFLCNKCDRAFGKSKEISRHMGANAGRQDHPTKPFKCCNQKFTTFTKLCEHQTQSGCILRAAQILFDKSVSK